MCFYQTILYNTQNKYYASDYFGVHCITPAQQPARTVFQLTSGAAAFDPEMKHFDSSRRTPQRFVWNLFRRRDTQRQDQGLHLRSTVCSKSDASCVTNSQSIRLKPTGYVVST